MPCHFPWCDDHGISDSGAVRICTRRQTLGSSRQSIIGLDETSCAAAKAGRRQIVPTFEGAGKRALI